MLENLIVSELIKAAVSVGKDILGNRVKEKNKELLERKRKKENAKKKRKSRDKKTGLSEEELSKILLDPNEEVRAELLVPEGKVKNNLISQVKDVRKWCELVSFRDLRSAKSVHQIYIELDTYIMPLRTHVSEKERLSIKPLQDAVFETTNHVVLLGQPGAGKTTSMKKLCSNFFSEEDEHPYSFPILIRFRDLNASLTTDSIIEYLSRLFDLVVRIESEESGEFFEEEFGQAILPGMLDALKPLIVLDGFDELPTQEQKNAALKEIRTLTDSVNRAKIIITSRTGEFNYHLDYARVYEISSLSETQIGSFAEKWIGDSKKAKQFVEDIKQSPFSDTTIKPLSLAHLCAIYERVGSIPDRPKTVYKKVVNLMLEEWDEQRSIKRVSRYAKFESDRKFEFLTHLSYHLTVHGQTGVFTQEQIIDAYHSICGNFGLPREQSAIAANEIESHTGLFLQTGYLQYEFAHKSLQEYLTAEYLVKLPSLEKTRGYIERLGAELAVATSISSNPSLYFTEIVLGIFNRGSLTDSFYNAFVSRLSQERPDFYPSGEIVLAAFTLLSERQTDEKYLLLMQSIIRNSDTDTLSQYYRVEHQGVDGKIVLRRKTQHDEYKLKTKLVVPSGQYSKLVAVRA